jgi:hypothetical protein
MSGFYFYCKYYRMSLFPSSETPPTSREKTEKITSITLLVLLVVLFFTVIIFIISPNAFSAATIAKNNGSDSSSVNIHDSTVTTRDTLYINKKDTVHTVKKENIYGSKKTITNNIKPASAAAQPCTSCTKDRLDSAHSYFILVFGALLLLIVVPRLKSFKFGKEGVSGELSDAAKDVINKVTASEVKQDAEPDVKSTDETAHRLSKIASSDPQKGLWGGLHENNFRKVIASFERIPTSDKFINVTLEVMSTDPIKRPLTGHVMFHLHPTFRIKNVKIYVINGVARLTFPAWGAFTAGIEADQGETLLEIDLAKEPTAPPLFRDR